MELAEWARSQGMHPQTAYRWFRAGMMPVPARRLATGTIMVEVAAVVTRGDTALYTRVSSHDQRADLDRQTARLAAGSGLHVAAAVAEAGSGLNGKRPKPTRFPADASVTVIVVEHRDRLARLPGAGR